MKRTLWYGFGAIVLVLSFALGFGAGQRTRMKTLENVWAAANRGDYRSALRSPEDALRSLEDAEVAYERRDFATALRLLDPLANGGYDIAGPGWLRHNLIRQAQLLLGHMYTYSNGVPHDYVKAYLWFELVGGGRLEHVRRSCASHDPGADKRSAGNKGSQCCARPRGFGRGAM